MARHMETIWEAVTWITIIVFTIITTWLFPWYTAQNLLRYILVGSGAAAIFWYFRSRRLYIESQKKTREIEQKQRELQSNQKAIGLIFEYSADGILVLNQEQKIEVFSPGLERITGYSQEEARGKSAKEILKFRGDSENSLLPDVMFMPNNLAKKPYIKNTLTTKEGREIDIEASSTLIQESDKANPKALAIIRDVTYENELVRRDKEFIAITSHQLNTPLSIIRGYVSLLLKGKVGNVTEKQDNYLSEIEKSVKKMIALTNSLLSVSRIEQGKIKLQKADVNVSDLLSGLREFFAHVACDKKLKIIFPEVGRAVIIYADADKLRQALSNLIDNAIKYTSRGQIEVDFQTRGSQAVFTVKDTGIGIPKEEMEKIGQKFYRTQRAIDIDNQGTGLGVFIAKTIIEKHSGNLTISSTPEKGSIFTINLPLNQEG